MNLSINLFIYCYFFFCLFVIPYDFSDHGQTNLFENIEPTIERCLICDISCFIGKNNSTNAQDLICFYSKAHSMDFFTIAWSLEPLWFAKDAQIQYYSSWNYCTSLVFQEEVVQLAFYLYRGIWYQLLPHTF